MAGRGSICQTPRLYLLQHLHVLNARIRLVWPWCRSGRHSTIAGPIPLTLFYLQAPHPHVLQPTIHLTFLKYNIFRNYTHNYIQLLTYTRYTHVGCVRPLYTHSNTYTEAHADTNGHINTRR